MPGGPLQAVQHGAGYEDNVVSWPSVEPSADYTAISLLAFALGGVGQARAEARSGPGVMG